MFAVQILMQLTQMIAALWVAKDVCEFSTDDSPQRCNERARNQMRYQRHESHANFTSSNINNTRR